ncbi:MAG TPA: lipoprotein signal peptidase, partial [Prevotella sp.]|nr:lipoprotein signal peptidase [Prevotella sp.]
SLLLFCRKELEALGGGDKKNGVKDASSVETAEEKKKSESQENKEDK